METVLINIKKKSDVTFLIILAKKLGMSAKALSPAEIEYWEFAQQIEEGMKTPTISRNSIMKTLGKRK